MKRGSLLLILSALLLGTAVSATDLEISNSVTINAAPEQVFFYAVRPKYWPEWHPASVKVSGPTSTAGVLGSTFVETVKGAGDFTWVVTKFETPTRWQIAGTSAGMDATITYLLERTKDGHTKFTRKMVVARGGSGLFAGAFLKAQSRQAVENFRKLVESSLKNAPESGTAVPAGDPAPAL